MRGVRAAPHRHRPAATAPATATPAAGATEPSVPVSPQVAEQVRQEVAAAKAENCKKAEESYARAVQARRMYKVDAQGVKTYLNDAELDATRLNARTVRDDACKP
jgi:hypothetical protein